MFDNAGPKIRSLAIILFVINCIAIITSVVYLFCYCNYPWYIFIIGVIALITVYIESLFISAFGELVENTANIRLEEKENNNN